LRLWTLEGDLTGERPYRHYRFLQRFYYRPQLHGMPDPNRSRAFTARFLSCGLVRTQELLESSFVDVADSSCESAAGDHPSFEATLGHPFVNHTRRDAGDRGGLLGP